MKQSKKKWGVLLLALALCGSVLAGCDANAAVPQDNSSMEQMQGVPEGGGPQEGTPPDMEDGGTAPSGELSEKGSMDEEAALAENQSRIVGKVTSVVGNEVVLALGSYGSSEESRNTSGTDTSQESTPSGGPEKSAPPDGDGTTGAQGEAPAEAAASEGGASQETAGSSSGSRSQKRGSFSESGVTQTLQIPVGLALTGAGGSGRSQDYSSVTTGMLLQITLEQQDDGSESVVAVRVLSK